MAQSCCNPFVQVAAINTQESNSSIVRGAERSSRNNQSLPVWGRPHRRTLVPEITTGDAVNLTL